ncbi:necrosis inducing protein-domain-containing protein [Aspergillus karnatakaensis]|uniref:NPP1 family protein n=1 Tax=Aspergillus karnatakaensis TaxID=1810916 RepID=UPI003CCD316A
MASRTLLLASLAVTAASMPLANSNSNTTPVTPLTARDVIDHDAVAGLPETLPSGTLGDIYRAYQPYLEVEDGCVPFPAVDADGNTSGGLAPTGSSTGDCSSSTGQVYARSTMSDGLDATYGAGIMYSWYFPKDSPSTGLGHRHDWEGVIVWLADGASSTAENVVAVCPSAHGDWNCDTSFSLSGTHPLIRYFNVWPVNHQLGLTDSVGGSQPLVAWESVGSAVRDALESTDFGSATVPFKEGTFGGNLGEATY